MTRGAFLFRLLAVVGLGQEVCSEPDKEGKRLCYTLECKPGEERCPLGHCQKPRILFDLGDGEHCYVRRTDPNATYTEAERAAGIVKFQPCVETPDTLIKCCSTCGIVYVPMTKEK